jgi:8-oxo-dGTP pyrophosphatase MutT (NUDIX family)
MKNFDAYLNDPVNLYRFIEKKLTRRKPKTYQYAKVPAKNAAVIIPLFYKDKQPCILFTKRTDKVEHHKGQISFPGGAHETNDQHLQETALRETWEEMGIRPEDMTVIGRTDNFLTNTHFMVTPFVAHFSYPYAYLINKDEIEDIIEVPLRHLMKPETFRMEKWEKESIIWDIHYYHFDKEVIWGVTGFLLTNFLSLVFNLSHLKLKPSAVR